jgi:putative ABC transport system permease protein
VQPVRRATAQNPVNAVVLAMPHGSPAQPKVSSGRAPRSPDEVLVGDRAPFDTDSIISVGGRDLVVVGRVKDLSLNGGSPVVVADLSTVQRDLMGGAALATGGVVTTRPAAVPQGFHVVDAAAARDDGLRLLAPARRAITLVTLLLWLVAASIIGSMIYLSAAERSRDFAVFKVTGTSTGSLALGVAVQAVVLSLAAALVGAVAAVLLTHAFPVTITITPSTVALLFVVATGVGIVASAFGLRRAVSVEPALAFGSVA